MQRQLAATRPLGPPAKRRVQLRTPSVRGRGSALESISGSLSSFWMKWQCSGAGSRRPRCSPHRPSTGRPVDAGAVLPPALRGWTPVGPGVPQARWGDSRLQLFRRSGLDISRGYPRPARSGSSGKASRATLRLRAGPRGTAHPQGCRRGERRWRGPPGRGRAAGTMRSGGRASGCRTKASQRGPPVAALEGPDHPVPGDLDPADAGTPAPALDPTVPGMVMPLPVSTWDQIASKGVGVQRVDLWEAAAAGGPPAGLQLGPAPRGTG